MQSSVVLIVSALLVTSTGAAEDESELRARLLRDYGSIATRPGAAAMMRAAQSCASGTAPPDQVETQLYVDSYMPLDSVAQTWGIVAYVRIWWTDVRLAYNGTEDGGCTDELYLSRAESDLIWKPILYWEHAREITLPDAKGNKGELMHIYPSGRVWWSRQMEMKITCATDFEQVDRFPFDVQSCVYITGMYSEPSHKVAVRWRENPTSPSNVPVAIENWDGPCLASWHAVELLQDNITYVYNNGNYSYARATVRFARAPSMFIESYLIPSVVIVFLASLGFYLPPDKTPARITLGITGVLAVLFNLGALLRVVPRTVHPTWLSRFVTTSFIFNVVACCEQVIVSYGLVASQWLEHQRRIIAQNVEWTDFLLRHAEKRELGALFKEWDAECVSQRPPPSNLPPP